MKATGHIWVVGIVTLLWNSGGAFDYLIAKTANPSHTNGLDGCLERDSQRL